MYVTRTSQLALDIIYKVRFDNVRHFFVGAASAAMLCSIETKGIAAKDYLNKCPSDLASFGA
jgi:hypothetical protein